jgi:hypothetical protein
MAAILRIKNQHGQCDRRCHVSRSHKCRCLCGGRFHGMGIEPAWDAMREAVDAGVFGPDATMSGWVQNPLPGFGGEHAPTGVA